MSPKEVAWGWVPGGATGAPSRSSESLKPLEALEEAIRPALLQPPCFVEFSGGRDSSLVLAVALGLARREGHPEPVAVTKRFPGIEDADENRWQAEVADYLGLRQWEICELGSEMDLVGPEMQRSLLRNGLLWPTGAHTRWLHIPRGTGGSVITGEGGDEVLGPMRITPLRRVLKREDRLSRQSLKKVGSTLVPLGLRISLFRNEYRRIFRAPWLRPAARRELEDALARDTAEEPLDWRMAVRRHPLIRGVRLANDNFEILAARAGLKCVQPLLAANFLDALARAGGRFGFSSRTEAMRALFRSLLPDAVLGRESKATFNLTVFNEYTRVFVDEWNGEGVDDDVVDVEALRRTWTAPVPHGMSCALVQACWLAMHLDEAVRATAW